MPAKKGDKDQPQQRDQDQQRNQNQDQHVTRTPTGDQRPNRPVEDTEVGEPTL